MTRKTRPLRIAVLTHTHPSVTRGGAEISALALHRGFLRLGHQSILIAMCPEHLRAKADVALDERLIYFNPLDYDNFYHIAPAETLGQLSRILEEVEADVLIAHHFLFVGVNTLSAVAASLPVTLVLHEFLLLCFNHGQMLTTGAKLCSAAFPVRCAACFPERHPAQFAVRQAFLKRHLQQIAHFVSPSHFLADRVKEWGLPADRINVIENGLIAYSAHETEAEQPIEAPEQNGGVRVSGASDVPLVIGYFGQLNPFKGLDVILEAAEQLAAAAFGRRIVIRVHGTVVNLGQDLQARFDAAVESRLIDYRGAYDNDLVLPLMRACDYILMASRWWENSPVVIQEAFLARRPLLVPGRGGMAEKVADGISGFHYEGNDGGSLAAVIQRAASASPSMFKFPPVYSAEAMAKNYLECVRGKRGSAVQDQMA